MSRVPKEWRIVELSEVAQTQLGKMLSPKAKAGARLRPYLRNRDVQWGSFNVKNLPVMNFTEEESIKYDLQSGDLVVCEGGEVGRSAIWRQFGEEIHFQKALHRVRCAPGLMPEYLRYLMLHYSYSGAFDQHVTGSTIDHLPQEDLRRLPIPLPPLREQHRIVDIIDEHFSRLDAAEAAASRAKDKATLLTADALEVAARLPAPERSIGDLEAPDRKISYGVLQPGDNVPGGVPLIRVGDIYSGRISVDNLKAIAPDIALAYSRTDLRGGEVLLTIVGTIGRAAVVPPSLAGANVARAVAVLPLNEQVLPEFVSIVLNARSSRVALTRAAHEVARKTLNLEDVRKFMLPIPSIPVQRTIVGEVERRNSILDAVTRSAETAITRSQRLRDAVLRAAFCGQFGMSRS